jgi:uncharacterized protein YycO
MKKLMKKLLAVVAAMTMVMGLAVTANAAELTEAAEGATNKTITITSPSGVADDETVTYHVYKVFDATSDGKSDM